MQAFSLPIILPSHLQPFLAFAPPLHPHISVGSLSFTACISSDLLPIHILTINKNEKDILSLER